MKMLIARALLLSLLFVTRSGAGGEMYPITQSDRAFFEQVRKAILADDVKWLARALFYPFDVHLKKRKLHLDDSRAFEKNASLILDRHLKSVVQKQSADSLWKNWQGVMVGQGELWFSQGGGKTGKQGGRTWVYHIIAINLNTEARK